MTGADDCDAVVLLPCAAVGVRTRGDAVCEIRFLPAGASPKGGASDVARRACEQILSYGTDPSHVVDVPLAIVGSEFQRRVWAAICRIPAGSTLTYGELAAELGSNARAVGQACGDNCLPIAIPCHRVVAAHGLGGFAHRAGGAMLDVKRWLLAHESRPTFALTSP
jgi:methylated-DNA-[protein]-cysteine S-methyltransferase